MSTDQSGKKSRRDKKTTGKGSAPIRRRKTSTQGQRGAEQVQPSSLDPGQQLTFDEWLEAEKSRSAPAGQTPSPDGDAPARGSKNAAGKTGEGADPKKPRRGGGGGSSHGARGHDGKFGHSCDVGSLKRQGVRYTPLEPPRPAPEEPWYDTRYRPPAEGHAPPPSDGRQQAGRSGNSPGYYTPPRTPAPKPTLSDGRSPGSFASRSARPRSLTDLRRLRSIIGTLNDLEADSLADGVVRPPPATGTPTEPERVDRQDRDDWGLDEQDVLPDPLESASDLAFDPATAFANPAEFDPAGAFDLPALDAHLHADNTLADPMAEAFTTPADLSPPATEILAPALDLEQRVLNDPLASTVDHHAPASAFLDDPLLTGSAPAPFAFGAPETPQVPADGLAIEPDLDQRVLGDPLAGDLGMSAPEPIEDPFLDFGGLEQRLLDPVRPPGMDPFLDPWRMF